LAEPPQGGRRESSLGAAAINVRASRPHVRPPFLASPGAGIPGPWRRRLATAGAGIPGCRHPLPQAFQLAPARRNSCTSAEAFGSKAVSAAVIAVSAARRATASGSIRSGSPLTCARNAPRKDPAAPAGPSRRVNLRHRKPQGVQPFHQRGLSRGVTTPPRPPQNPPIVEREHLAFAPAT
jgi:hypothetical protein